MFKFYFLKIIAIIFLFLFLLKTVYAQGAAADQYKQMGGIAGLTEVCFKTKNLELTLFKQIGQLFYTQPEMGQMMFGLLYSYFDAKSVAMEKKVVWNGTTQSYNKKQFDCNNAADKKLIKQFEMQLMNGLKSQG
ncbi:hypothetical protein OA505_04350 [Alphaproteobacteria bacterium]|nr:hypothetical protein [Alphaproteobacteria bacterium]